MPFDASQFFTQYAALEPEEATTLGLEAFAGQLRDMSAAGYARRCDLFRATRDDLQKIAATERALDINESTLLRHCEFEIHAHDAGFQAANPQWATYPYTTSRYLAARQNVTDSNLKDREGPYFKRAGALPQFLRDHEERLLEARDRGQVAHRAFLECLRDYEIPAARAFFELIDEEAGAALTRHQEFLERELLDQAPEHMILGADRYAERLKLSYHIDEPLEDLVNQAMAALTETQAEMVEVANSLDEGQQFKNFADLREFMLLSQKQSLPEDCDLKNHYRSIMARAMDHLVAAKEFLAIDVMEVGMADFPEGMRDQGPGTNWPAPLFDPKGKGQFVLHPDPKAHSEAWSSVLAVHEGAPGHFLQSQGFRRHLKDQRAAMAHIAVADDVAIPRLNFSSMLNIEGYAVYAESCLRRSGFHQGRDQLFALAAHALRAVRVVAEINLHRGTFSPKDCEAFVMANAGLPSAFWELQRYQRGPLQAVAYFFGAEQFQALRTAVQEHRGSSFSAAAFHEEILAYGPALPEDIQVELLKTTAPN